MVGPPHYGSKCLAKRALVLPWQVALCVHAYPLGIIVSGRGRGRGTLQTRKKTKEGVVVQCGWRDSDGASIVICVQVVHEF